MSRNAHVKFSVDWEQLDTILYAIVTAESEQVKLSDNYVTSCYLNHGESNHIEQKFQIGLDREDPDEQVNNASVKIRRWKDRVETEAENTVKTMRQAVEEIEFLV